MIARGAFSKQMSRSCRRRVAAFNDIERSVKLVEGQLQSIENFFGLVNDQVVTLPTPERVSSLDFEQLSDSIAMTKQMLEETSDTFAALDSTIATSEITNFCSPIAPPQNSWTLWFRQSFVWPVSPG